MVSTFCFLVVFSENRQKGWIGCGGREKLNIFENIKYLNLDLKEHLK